PAAPDRRQGGPDALVVGGVRPIEGVHAAPEIDPLVPGAVRPNETLELLARRRGRRLAGARLSSGRHGRIAGATQAARPPGPHPFERSRAHRAVTRPQSTKTPSWRWSSLVPSFAGVNGGEIRRMRDRPW